MLDEQLQHAIRALDGGQAAVAHNAVSAAVRTVAILRAVDTVGEMERQLFVARDATGSWEAVARAGVVREVALAKEIEDLREALAESRTVAPVWQRLDALAERVAGIGESVPNKRPDGPPLAAHGIDIIECERERCAQHCEVLAWMMENGAGEGPTPGSRLRQAARNIRTGKDASLWTDEMASPCASQEESFLKLDDATMQAAWDGALQCIRESGQDPADLIARAAHNIETLRESRTSEAQACTVAEAWEMFREAVEGPRRESPKLSRAVAMTEAFQEVVSRDVAEHVRAGRLVATERDGRVVYEPPGHKAGLAPRRIVAGDRLRITSLHDTWEADVIAVNPRNLSWPIHIVKVTDSEHGHRKGAEFEWGLDDLTSLCHADGAPIDPPPFWHDEMRRRKRGPYKEAAPSVGPAPKETP